MKYQAFFEFVDTEQAAQLLCAFKNKHATPYMRKKHPAHYTKWSSSDNTIHKFVCWFHI